MPKDHEDFMRAAIAEAARAAGEGNVGVGSVIVRADSVVATGRNLVTSTADPTAHAETVALRNAKLTDLAGHTLYTTYEPCPMCCGAIMAGGISTLFMGARPEPSENRWGEYTVENLVRMAGWTDRLEVVTGVLVDECAEAYRG